METVQLKYDIISWLTELKDRQLVLQLYQWKKEHESAEVSIDGVIPPRRKGSLTEGFGIWANNAPFDETNYREQLWQTEKNAW